MQHYGVNGYSLHAMNSLSAMYNLHQQAAQQAQHAPDYRPSVHALTLAERLAGKGRLWGRGLGGGGEIWEKRLWKVKTGGSTGNVYSGRLRKTSIQNLCVSVQSTLVCQHCAGPWSCPMPSDSLNHPVREGFISPSHRWRD